MEVLWQLSSQNKAGVLVMAPANSDILILPPLIKLKKIIKKSCQSWNPSDQPFWIRALLLACTQTGQNVWFDTSWLMESQLIWMYNIFETVYKQVYHCTHFRPDSTSGSDLDPNDSVPERFFLKKVDFDKKKLADDKKIIKKISQSESLLLRKQQTKIRKVRDQKPQKINNLKTRVSNKISASVCDSIFHGTSCTCITLCSHSV